ncbi:MAG TPA: FAD:protein FMN transferase [Fimbriimonas sp.]|nr:FAD:protein FMN transferase [Fimbriimonas sp.]
MGVEFRLSVYANDSSKAANVAKTVFARVRQLDEIMSDYIQESELNRVNRTAYEKDVKVSDDLFRVLSLARKAYVVSGGLFDPTIGPLSQIWRAARRSGQLPDPQAVTAARATVGFDKVRLYSLNQSVRFLVPGVKLDLGGIGKGFACQEAIIVATKAGCESAMIEGGGDMFFSKAPPGESGWEVELPNGETRAFKNTALSTSGNETQFTEINGRRYAHIIDPRKGWGAESKPGLVWKSSSVIGKNGALVDAYATVLFLDSSRWFSLGRGYEYIEHQSLKFEKL